MTWNSQLKSTFSRNYTVVQIVHKRSKLSWFLSGLVGFMGNGDLWENLNGDLWEFMYRPRILFVPINPH